MPFPLGLRIIQCVKKNRPVETRTISNFQNEYETIKSSSKHNNTKNNKKTKKKLKVKPDEKDNIERKTKKNNINQMTI